MSMERSDAHFYSPLIQTEGMSKDLDALVSSSVRIVVLDDTTDRSDGVPVEVKVNSVSHHAFEASPQNTI